VASLKKSNLIRSSDAGRAPHSELQQDRQKVNLDRA
jgi:hypothetical protein